MSQKLILALDFGNTKIAAGICYQGSKEWINYKRVVMPSCRDAKDHLNQMIELADELLGGSMSDAIGISFGGPVDPKTGFTVLSHSHKGWENFDLPSFLKQKYNCPVINENDANVATVGEHSFGAGAGVSSMFFITASTGVGGGVIINNQLWKGYQGLAGEIGHMIVDAKTGPRWWGRRGCIYRISSGTFTARRARRWVQDEPFKGGILKEMSNNDPYKITTKMVAQAAEAGDQLAWEALEESAWALGLGIANTANILNPELFVIGGSLVKAGDRYWNRIIEIANQNKMPEVEFKIVKAKLGDEAPLWGAVAMAEKLITN